MAYLIPGKSNDCGCEMWAATSTCSICQLRGSYLVLKKISFYKTLNIDFTTGKFDLRRAAIHFKTFFRHLEAKEEFLQHLQNFLRGKCVKEKWPAKPSFKSDFGFE